MISKNKPKKIIICSLYFLDEKATGGWADKQLKFLGYDNDPTKL